METGFKGQPRCLRGSRSILDESSNFSITVEASDHGVVLGIKGEMDAATAHIVGRALEAVVGRALEAGDQPDSHQVIVDLEHVTFIDSRGLLALLQGRARLAQRHIRLLIRKPQAQARRLFDLALNGEQFDEASAA